MFLFTDIFRMIQQINRQGAVISAWGALLNIPQFVGGLIFIQALEGQVVLVLIIGTLMVAAQIFKRTPFTRLTGICHLPWLLMLPWLIHRIAAHEHGIWLSAWLQYVVGVVAISLIFDAMDLWRYARGQTTFSWRR